MNIKNKKDAGFTLVEMMIALLVGSIVMIGLIVTFIKQSDIKVVQEDVTEILQNSRAARVIISDNLRMAGYYGPNGPSETDLPFYTFDATASAAPVSGGLAGNAVTVRFWEDNPLPGVGLTARIKTVGYALYDSNDDLDGNLDDLSLVDSNINSIVPPLTHADMPRLPLIGNIDALEFLYIINDGTNAVNTITRTPTLAQIRNIMAVKVTMLLRGKSNRTGQGVVDTNIYRSSFGTTWGPFDDGFKRRITSFTVHGRNLGL